MELFSQNELMLMIGVVSVLLFSILVLALLDLKDRKKEKKNKIVVADESIEFGEKMEEELTVEPPKEDMIEVLELSDELVVNDASEETLEPVMDEENILKKKEVQYVQEEKINLEEELNKALESLPKEDAVESYEMEQERTAIISLDELMKKSDDLYNENEVMQYDDGNEPISIDEVMHRMNVNEEKSVPEVMQNIVEDNNMSFENTATYEKLSRETQKDFMTRLREANENNH